MAQLVQEFFAQHGSLVGGVGIWMALSLAVNLLLLLKGPKAWVDDAKKNSKVALAINVLFRAFGVDLVSVIIHLRDYLSAKAKAEAKPAPPPAATPEEEKKP